VRIFDPAAKIGELELVGSLLLPEDERATLGVREDGTVYVIGEKASGLSEGFSYSTIDLADTSSPKLVHGWDLHTGGTFIGFFMDYVVIQEKNSFSAIDVSDPSNPVVEGNYSFGYPDFVDGKVVDGKIYVFPEFDYYISVLTLTEHS
jgi:hypothetical protein